MSRHLSFVELINLAIGTPEVGHVNFNALHLLLHSLVEHLRLRDVRKEVSADELEFIRPPASALASAAPSATEGLPVQRSSSVFHQMQERISALERQLRVLNQAPDTAELLARTQGMGQPALDMWQMMQLRKKMELNEEGMTKAMNTLQDLLNSICSLKSTTESFQQELGQLKEDVAQINGEEMKARLLGLDNQARMMEEMKEQLGLVKEKVTLSPSASDVVCWSALCETLTGKICEEEGREEKKGGREEKEGGREEEERGREEEKRRREEEKRRREEEKRRREEEKRRREEEKRCREEEKRCREEERRRRDEEERRRDEEERRRDEEERRREDEERRRGEQEGGTEEERKRREEERRRREEERWRREEERRRREDEEWRREEEERRREDEESRREEEERRREEEERRREEGGGGVEEEKRGREKTSREILAVLSQLPEKHEALLQHIMQLEAQLKYPAGPAAFQMSPELKSLLERMEILQVQSQQGKESLRGTLEQLEKLRQQYENLQQGVEKLARSSMETQILRNMLHQLDVKKADKDLIQQEMKVKADKSALESMVNHGQLQLATSQLSEMMHDLLQKMSLQDKDWQKALEKLFVDMDCKLDRLALDPVSRQLEEVWKFIKKFLSEGPRFDADSAAGFKKQLFERVKCISCDRPVTMMTGPHMITVRKATLKPRPASAGGYEYLFHQQKRDQDPSDPGGNPPLQTCWQCQTQQQASALKHLSRAQDFATLYPYGDPTAITYDNTEVDILGVNGVLYKGRVNSHATERTIALQKEFAALKIPRPPTGLRMERIRSAYADVSAVPYPSSVLRRVGSAIANSTQRPQQLSCDPVDRAVLDSALSESNLQSERDVPGL